MFGKIKNLFLSRTIRAGGGMVLVSVLGIAGITLTEVEVEQWMQVATLGFTAVSGLVAVAGRVAAGGPIGLATLPGVIVPVLNGINKLLKQRT